MTRRYAQRLAALIGGLLLAGAVTSAAPRIATAAPLLVPDRMYKAEDVLKSATAEEGMVLATPSGEKNPKLAMLYSLLLPGLGEHYLGHSTPGEGLLRGGRRDLGRVRRLPDAGRPSPGSLQGIRARERGGGRAGRRRVLPHRRQLHRLGGALQRQRTGASRGALHLPRRSRAAGRVHRRARVHRQRRVAVGERGRNASASGTCAPRASTRTIAPTSRWGSWWPIASSPCSTWA